MTRKTLIILVTFLVLASAGGVFLARRHAGHGAQEHAAVGKWQCPMHPEIIADKPGSCPICNMDLVAMEERADGAEEAQSGSGARFCLLHDCKMAGCRMELPLSPGETVHCPVCGTHVAEEPTGEPVYYRHPDHPERKSPEPAKTEDGRDFIAVYVEQMPGGAAGQAAVTIGAEQRQLMGVKSEAVERRALARTVRASGRVAYDPDLYNAIAEYREAVRSRERLADSVLSEPEERSQSLVDASAIKLRQMGLSEAQIAAAAKEDAPTSLLVGGGLVWVYAQIYEQEVGLVKPGQTVTLTTPAYPGRAFKGTLRSLDPILDPMTRSLKARVAVPNPDGALKLEMYVNAEVKVDLGRQPALPESALIDTGERRLVFVDLGEGRIEPRVVEVGAKAGGYYELKSGIEEGEKVVTSANFLVDSESRLKAAIKKAAPGGGEADPHAGHRR
jgi:Cu(I)/Ag(I) efflux system membrane fusion protein